MRVIVTGGRTWKDVQTIAARLDLVPRPFILVHGDNPTGADRIAVNWARTTPGVMLEEHPADWHRFDAAAGPMRNEQMAALGADLCLAFPMPGSKGTWDMIRRCVSHNIPREIIRPKSRSLPAHPFSVGSRPGGLT